MSGRVTLNGEPVAGSSLTFHTDSAGNNRWTNLGIDPNGRYRIELIPDKYRSVLRLADGGNRQVTFRLPDLFAIEPGQWKGLA